MSRESSGTYGNATKGAAEGRRVKEKSSTCLMTKGTGTLQRRHSR